MNHLNQAYSEVSTIGQYSRKYFSYFYDDTAATAIVPYKDVFFDKCGARDRNSWIVKKYFYDKGIDIFKI